MSINDSEAFKTGSSSRKKKGVLMNIEQLIVFLLLKCTSCYKYMYTHAFTSCR